MQSAMNGNTLLSKKMIRYIWCYKNIFMSKCFTKTQRVHDFKTENIFQAFYLKVLKSQ